MMEVFPTFFNMTGARVVVFGTGQDAVRKIRLLLRTEAEIVSIGTPGADWPASEFMHIGQYPFEEAASWISGATFSIVAEENAPDREKAIDLVRKHRVSLNVVDHKGLSDFIIPSFVERGKFVAAVSTSGAAPVVGQRMRAQIEMGIPVAMENALEIAAGVRAAVRIRFTKPNERRAFWGKFADAVFARADAGPFGQDELNYIFDLTARKISSDIIPSVGVLSISQLKSTDDVTLGTYKFLQSCDIAIIETGVGSDWIDLIRRDAVREIVPSPNLPGSLMKILESSGKVQSVCVLGRDVDVASDIELACKHFDVRVLPLR